MTPDEPFAASEMQRTCPSKKVILESEAGSFRFCIGERKFIRIKGTDGLTLRLTPKVGGFGGLVIDTAGGFVDKDNIEQIAPLAEKGVR